MTDTALALAMPETSSPPASAVPPVVQFLQLLVAWTLAKPRVALDLDRVEFASFEGEQCGWVRLIVSPGTYPTAHVFSGITQVWRVAGLEP